jgi:hypothetical protein
MVRAVSEVAGRTRLQDRANRRFPASIYLKQPIALEDKVE